MSIFIGQLVGFVLLVLLFVRYVLPPLRKAVGKQKDTIDRQVSDSEEAQRKVADAQQARERSGERADAEAKELHQGALTDAEGIRGDFEEQTESEVKRIGEHGRSQAELTRSGMVRSLRSEVGLSAVVGAGELVREHLADPQNQSAHLDRVIDELDQMSGSARDDSVVPGTSDLVGIRAMRAASRDAALAVSKQFDDEHSGADGSTLVRAAEDLTTVLVFLDANPVLRKRLTEDEENPDGKRRMVHSLFDGKVSAPAVSIVASASAQRWSSTSDYVTALRRQSALLVLTAAERDGVIERVEDELFRVGRIFEANAQLASLLSDHSRSADKRVELLNKLIGSQVDPHTWTLLDGTVRLSHGQPIDVAVDMLAELAAARRGESVAHVVSAAELSDAQRTRLEDVLGRIYHRRMSVQTEIDRELIGGLRVAVGDEVIEADTATRLSKAAQSLPR